MIRLALALGLISVFAFVIFFCVTLAIRYFQHLDSKEEEAKNNTINSQTKPKTENEN